MFHNYQEDIAMPLDHKFDIEAAPDLKDEEHESLESTANEVLPAIYLKYVLIFFGLYILIIIRHLM